MIAMQRSENNSRISTIRIPVCGYLCCPMATARSSNARGDNFPAIRRLTRKSEAPLVEAGQRSESCSLKECSRCNFCSIGGAAARGNGDVGMKSRIIASATAGALFLMVGGAAANAQDAGGATPQTTPPPATTTPTPTPHHRHQHQPSSGGHAASVTAGTDDSSSRAPTTKLPTFKSSKQQPKPKPKPLKQAKQKPKKAPTPVAAAPQPPAALRSRRLRVFPPATKE